MSVRDFENTIEEIQSISRSSDIDTLSKSLLRSASRFGITNILSGFIPDLSKPAPLKPRNAVVLDQWPAEWGRRYFENGYITKDPTIRRLNAGVEPFTWGEVTRETVRGGPGKRVMEEARDFRLNDGFTIAIRTLEGDIVGLSLAGEQVDLSANARGAMQLLSTYAIAKSLELISQQCRSPANLTARELSALRWAAEGKSRWEIGNLMGISEHGADKHLRTIRSKLGTTTTAFAIAEAFRAGLIT